MAETLDRAALAKLRRLHEEATPGPWRQVGGMVAFGPLDARESGANPALIVEMRNALPSLLALVERVAAIDPALLDRLAQRYEAEPEPGPCPKCGTARKMSRNAVRDKHVWYCPNHPSILRYTEAGDLDVLALVAAIRGEAVADAS